MSPDPRPGVPIDIVARSDRRSRLGREVPVSEAFLARIGDVCAEVDRSELARLDAGRDWWPLALVWAVEGLPPAWPAAVARPSTAGEVAAVLGVCNDAGVPVTAAGGRSGVCGASVPAFGGLAVDLRALSGIVAVDGTSLLVDVRAGTFLDSLEATLRNQHRMTLGHWPQSMALATLGGALACRGAGQLSTRYGKIEDMVVGLEVALADGRLISTGGRAPRAATGPDLTQLFVGSEGTLGVITEARVRTHPRPVGQRRAAFGFTDFEAGLDACRRILQRGATPAVLRLYDETESSRSFTVEGTAVLIVMDEGDPRLIDAVAGVVSEECGDATALDEATHHLVGRWLEHRMTLPPLEELVRGGIVADTIEIAGPWAALARIYREAVKSLMAIEGTLAASAHQSHAYGDGACLYFTFAGQPATEPETYYRQAWAAVTEAVLAAGGAISHHHGVGLARGRFMPEYLGLGFDVLATLKSALDPRGILNPGKLGLLSPFGAPPWP